MKEITLTKGQVALVDDDWYVYLSQWKWHATVHERGYYAERTATVSERLLGIPKHIYMHVVVNRTPLGSLTDHINGNPLDNQTANLRVATDPQNAHNTRKHRDSTSPYKGVYLSGNHTRWTARICINGVYKRLGTFDTALDAAIAYNAAAIEFFGEFAWLNDVD